MPLIQLADNMGDALDLWLSPNHEGQRRDAAQKREMWTHMVNKIPLFKGLEDFERSEICSLMRHRYFMKGDVLYHKDDPVDTMYIVEDGEVEVLSIVDDKPPVVVRTLGKGSVLGEYALMAAPGADVHADLMVRAEGQVGVAMLSRATLSKMLDHAVGTKDKLVLEHASVAEHKEHKGTGVIQLSGAGVVVVEGRKRVLELPELGPGALQVGMDSAALASGPRKKTFFSSAFGAPTVFVGKPEGRVICPQCKDVFRDPVVSGQGTTYCRDCVPRVEGEDLNISDMAPDDVVWNHILRMHILCRHGLVLKQTTMDGPRAWAFDRDGCTQYIKFQDRDLHEMTCQYEFVRCTLPDSVNTLDNCGQLSRGFQLAQHQKECMHRLVPCRYEGCSDRVQARKMLEHEGLCYHKPMVCPHKCGWEGTRRELILHRTTCGKQLVTCGRESTEEPGQACMHQLERRLQAAHDSVCEFRLHPCEWCRFPVSYIHMGVHLDRCPDRRELCQQCGQNVLARRFEEHKERFCGHAKVPCEFAKYGCSERLARPEMVYHMHDNAPQHLRLLLLAVEQVSHEYSGWYGRVDEVKEDLAAHVRGSASALSSHARDIVAIKDAGEHEVAGLRAELVDMQVAYEREVEALRAAVRDVRRHDEAKLVDLAAENAVLRGMLEACYTREEAQPVLREMQGLEGRLAEEVAATAEAVDAHQRAWERDLGEVKEGAAAARVECEDRLTEVQKMVALAQIDTTTKHNAMYDEISRITKEFGKEIEAAQQKQVSLESSIHEVNERLRPLTRGSSSTGAKSALRSGGLAAASK
eukprot:CAMPEP_0182906598 /NCGR_PEP_ID=MMETSP0034_2-20130328/33857_1 /TAXON_ID=156128 /ORGANISM="Nephroselmis pyriformis, Strain CCMP717" /LENGTH=807 /DNA_ID=CAMNT_0025042303 /DNA_START=404 /DNA_END=2824 /DNA_ORIENTATION=-